MQTKLPRAALLAVLSALVLFLAACGGDDSEDSGDLGPDPATMAPADAPVYMEAVVKPEGSLGDDVNSALSKITGEDDPGARIREMLDQELSEEGDGVSYSEDIEPWLGQRIGIFVNEISPDGEDADAAGVIALDDAGEAQSFIDEQMAQSDSEPTDESYNGVDYKYDSSDDTAVGIDGDFMLIGTRSGLEAAVDAGAGDSLADSSEAADALGEAPDDAIASMYVDSQSIVDLIKASGEIPPAQLKQVEGQLDQFASGPVSAWASVTDSSFGLSFSGPAAEGQGGPSELISTFPADSWMAFASADVGEALQTSLDQFTEGFKAGFEASAPPGVDASDYDPVQLFKEQTGLDLESDLTWMGDVGGFIEGTSVLGLGGGLVMETDDEQAATDAVDKIGQSLSRNRELSRDLEITPSDNGFSIQAAGAPIGAEVAVEDGKVVVAGGAATVDDVVNASDTLEGSDRFSAATDALGEGETPAFFLDFAPILSLVDSSGTTDPDYQAAKPYLDALDYVVIGSKLDGDRATGSFVLGVKEGSSDDSESTSAAIVP